MKLMAGVLLCVSTVAMADNGADLAFATGEMNHDKVSQWTMERLVTLKLPEKCWAKVADKKNMGHTLWSNHARTIQHIAHAMTGDDWSALESQSANSKEDNQKLVDKLVKDFAPKFHLTVIVDGDDCDASGNAMWLKYVSQTLSALEHYPPKSGKAMVTIHADGASKTVKTDVSKDGATFTIIGPKDREPSGWGNDVDNPIKRVSTKG